MRTLIVAFMVLFASHARAEGDSLQACDGRDLSYCLGYVAGRLDCRHDVREWRLYRSSVAVAGPIQVATFDAAEGDEYNRINCETGAQLFQAQPGLQVSYWCEPR